MSLVRLLTWASPAFPTGAFAYSHGLEWAVEAGDVTTEAAALDWIDAVLTDGTGRTDAILLRAAYRAGPFDGLRGNEAVAGAGSGHAEPVPFDKFRANGFVSAIEPGHQTVRAEPVEAYAASTPVAAVGDLARALAPTSERQAETTHQGAAFALAAAVWSGPADPAPYPVAFGHLACQQAVPEDDAVRAMLHALASSLISAAVRLVPLGQTAGLRILHALEPVIEAVAIETEDADLDDIGSACFRSDIASMRHETQHTRLFRS